MRFNVSGAWGRNIIKPLNAWAAAVAAARGWRSRAPTDFPTHLMQRTSVQVAPCSAVPRFDPPPGVWLEWRTWPEA
jgi:hypothetical protein